MRRYLIILSVLLMAVGCTESNETTDIRSITFSLNPIKVSEDIVGTKTGIVESGNSFNFIWVAKDTVGIYPDRGSQVYFEISDGAGSSVASFDGGGWAFKYSSVYYSYYPFEGDIYLDRCSIPVKYTGQRQPEKSTKNHIGVADFAYTTATSAESGTLTFNYNHLSCFVRFVLTNLPAGTYTKLTLKTPSPLLTKEGHYDLLSASPAIVPTVYTDEQSIELADFAIAAGEEVLVYMALGPVDLKGKTVTVSVLDSERKEYKCDKTPSRVYEAGQLYGLGCSTWAEVPQSVSFTMNNWDSGITIGGTAE